MTAIITDHHHAYPIGNTSHVAMAGTPRFNMVQPGLRYALAYCGALAVQGPPISWRAQQDAAGCHRNFQPAPGDGPWLQFHLYQPWPNWEWGC